MKKVILVLNVKEAFVQANVISLEDGSTLHTLSQKNIQRNTGIGKYEMNPDSLWLNLQTCLLNVLKLCSSVCEIACISFSFEGDALIPIDVNGIPLRDMLLPSDIRAQEEAKEISYLLGDRHFRSLTGRSCQSNQTCAKILWLKRHQPEIFKKTRYFLSIGEYIFHKMGIGVHTDFSLASRKSLFDTVTKKWSSEIASCSGIELSQAGGTVQDSTRIIAKLNRIGNVLLPDSVPIILGAHETECCLLGLGVNPHHNKIYGNISDTRETLGSFSLDRISSFPQILSELSCGFSENISSVSSPGISSQYVSWFQNKLCMGSVATDYMLEEKVHFNASSQVSFFLNDNKSKCTITGFDATTESHAIYQAILEGMAYRIKESSDSIEHTTGISYKALYCGGGNCSPKWLQFKSDLLKKEVRWVTNPQISSSGAAILAAIGIGAYANYDEAIANMVQVTDVFVPNPAISAAYQERFITYCNERNRYNHFL